MNIEYNVIRSGRKTIGISVRDGAVTVRAPRSVSGREIARAVDAHADWIKKKLREQEEKNERAAELPALSDEEIKALAGYARRVLPPLVESAARQLGVSYGKITVRCQRTRWGSCTSRGDLSFNCLLMRAPESVIRYIVAHELCHRLEMNHSARFYARLDRIIPDRKECEKWLKTEGAILMKRRKTD